MKTLKFMSRLADLILNGEKTVTWRLFDDKDLKLGDGLIFVRKETSEEFASAVITSVREKKLGEVSDDDYDGHEKYKDNTEMIESFKKYYGDKVDFETVVKIISFKLIK